MSLNWVFVTFVSAGAVFAQDSQQATLTGIVSDPSQSAVVGASVSATNTATGVARSALTNQAGVYNIVGLQPGVYELKVTQTGFKTVQNTGIVLNLGSTVRVDVTMQLGALTETILVTDVAPVLQTETGEVSTLVSGTQVTELPLNGRNFTQFLALGTGVVSKQTGRQMGLGQEGNPLMAVQGGRISMNKYTYDGTLAMDTGGNRGLDLFPPMEAIGEVRVQKSNYGADAGGFGFGIVNVVTKSGGREFHGDIYEYFRNDKLDARNFFANDRQTIRLNNFGFTLGGPFYIPGKYNTDKTKDFFFYSQTFARRVGPQMFSFTDPPQGVFTALVPTAAMRQGDFSGLATIRDPNGVAYPGNRIPASQIDPNALILLDAFVPLPNRVGAQNFVHNTRGFTRFREELVRWDHIFNDTWNVMVRYAQDTWNQDQDIKRPGASVLPTFPNLFSKPGKNLTTKLTTVVTPASVNLVTFGYSNNGITNVPVGGQRPANLTIPEAFPGNTYNRIPDITFAQGYAALGVGGVQVNKNPVYTIKDDFSVTRGRHSLKVGAEIIRHIKPENSRTNEQGSFNFNGGVTGHSISDFLIGRAFTYTENSLEQDIKVSGWDNEFYFQDDIKVSSNLTLNAGVRYYLIRGANGGAAEADNISTFVPWLYDPALAPTLLASGQLVPGTGDPLNGIITPDNLKGQPVHRDLRKPVNDAFGPRVGLAWSPGGRKTVFRAGYGINYFWGTSNNVPRKQNPPFGDSANVQGALLSNPTGGVGRVFPPAVLSMDIFPKQPSVQSWSFSIQRELMANTSLEIAYSGTRGTHLPRVVQLNQADPTRTGNANLRRPYLGYANINYNENSAVSKYHGLQLSLVRRFSRGLMFEASYTWSKALGHTEALPMDSRNKDLDFGLTELDRTHMFTYNAVWELPFFRNAKGFTGGILGGWQLSGILSFQSGLPFTVTQAGDVAGFGGGTGAQRPNRIGDPHEGRGESLNRYFNVDAFRAVTAAGTVGNEPVFGVRGPGINNLDLSLFKNIAFGESRRLQLGLETFNLFNHSQFEDVGSQLGSPAFGAVTSARDPRVMQLRAKFSF